MESVTFVISKPYQQADVEWKKINHNPRTIDEDSPSAWSFRHKAVGEMKGSSRSIGKSSHTRSRKGNGSSTVNIGRKVPRTMRSRRQARGLRFGVTNSWCVCERFCFFLVAMTFPLGLDWMARNGCSTSQSKNYVFVVLVVVVAFRFHFTPSRWLLALALPRFLLVVRQGQTPVRWNLRRAVVMRWWTSFWDSSGGRVR